MEVKQVRDIVNAATEQVLGKKDVLAEDLTGVVDLGEAIFNANAMDNFCGALVDRIGKTVFVDRSYNVSVPSVLMDGWTYGSVLQKVDSDLPEAEIDQSWDLKDGQEYPTDVFVAPKVHVKFFNGKEPFEIRSSITDIQLREAFVDGDSLNRFVSMLFVKVENSIKLKTDTLIMATIANMMGETIYSDYSGAALSTKSGTKVINILHLYNEEFNDTLTAKQALHDMNFLKYATLIISEYKDYIGRYSTIFNVGGAEKFTPADRLHLVLLSKFAAAADVYLQAPTFHNELTKLPNYEKAPYWQGTGMDSAFDFDSVSRINLVTSAGHAVDATGILGVMFDNDALGVCNVDRRVTTQYIPSAEFTNYWNKWSGQHFNDLNENMIVFVAA